MSSFKLLGVYIDCNLIFKENVSNISSKVYASLFSLKSKFFLSIETKLQFFKTFILPHFDYCISLSIYYSIELRQQLVKLYKFCLRKLLNIKFHNENNDKFNTQETNNLLKQYNLFSFEYRVFYRLSLFIHKINLNKFPLGLFNLINLNSSVKNSYNLRNKNAYFIPYLKNCTSKFSDLTFAIFFTKLINSLFLFNFNYPFFIFKNFLLSNLDSLYRKFNCDFKFFTLNLDY